MTENNKKPSLRFKGFNDTWEQRKLGYFFDERNERSGDGELISVTINSGIKKFSELNRFDSKPNDLSNYKVVVKNDIAYNSMRMWQGASGLSPYTGILSPAYTVITPKLGNSSLFFSYQIKKPEMIHLFEINSQGLTKDTWNLKFPAFSRIETTAPREFDEQEKIGTLFSQLDTLITLQQRKYDKLQNIKKGLLEKMFPASGSNIPKIRFKGFTDTWEHRKVGDLVVERNTQMPKSDKYPLMAFVANYGVSPKGDRYNREFLVTDEENKKYKITELGDFIYSSNNLETGSIGLNNYGNACISPVYSIFKPTELANSKFIGYRFVRKDFLNDMIKWRQGVIYGQWKIHESDFIQIEVKTPAVEEQKKIGNLFYELDTLITLQQRKRKILKNTIKNAIFNKIYIKKGGKNAK